MTRLVALRSALRQAAFRRLYPQTSVPTATPQILARNQSTAASSSSVLSTWYNIFGRSNIAYISWLVMGVIVSEAVTGWGTDAVWGSLNYGRTFETVDWSKFQAQDEDEDEEEDDEDE